MHTTQKHIGLRKAYTKGLWAQEQTADGITKAQYKRASGRKNEDKGHHKSAIVIQIGLWEQEQRKVTRSGPYLTLRLELWLTVILVRSVCLHSLIVEPVMRLKSKECILEN